MVGCVLCFTFDISFITSLTREKRFHPRNMADDLVPFHPLIFCVSVSFLFDWLTTPGVILPPYYLTSIFSDLSP